MICFTHDTIGDVSGAMYLLGMVCPEILGVFQAKEEARSFPVPLCCRLLSLLPRHSSLLQESSVDF